MGGNGGKDRYLWIGVDTKVVQRHRREWRVFFANFLTIKCNDQT